MKTLGKVVIGLALFAAGFLGGCIGLDVWRLTNDDL